MSHRVISIGSALLDVYFQSSQFKTLESGEFAGGVALCEAYGGKTEAESVAFFSGGGGTNTAVSFARKGFRVRLVAEMGDDLVAHMIEKELSQEGVDGQLLVKEVDEVTGVSAILVDSDGGRSAVVFRGASGMLTKEDVVWDELSSDWIYVSSLGGEVALLEALIWHARSEGISIAVNPGSQEIAAIIERSVDPAVFFEGVRVLLMNREEAAQLWGEDLSDDRRWRGEWGFGFDGMLVVTDGGNGGRVEHEGGVWRYEASQVKAVEETGAGDGFGSGLVAALVMGKSVETAISWGKEQAASVVSYVGAKRGLLELDGFSHWHD